MSLSNGRSRTTLAAVLSACAAIVVGALALTNLPALGEAMHRFADRIAEAFVLTEPSAINGEVIAALGDLNTDLSTQSGMARPLMLKLQSALLRLGRGNALVTVARDGELYLTEGIRYLTGPGFLEPDQLARRRAELSTIDSVGHPDPREAIVALNYELRKQRKRLVVLVVPPKAAVVALGGPRGSAPRGALENRSYQRFLGDLRRRDIVVVDAGATLFRLEASGQDAYLATDTHWSPAGLAAVTAELAQQLAAVDAAFHVEPVCPAFSAELEARTSVGLLGRLLGYDKGDSTAPRESIRVRAVKRPDGVYAGPSTDARVVIVGDSFTNIYSQLGLGWGEGAGLVEQLSLLLCEPIDAIAVNDGGAFQSRLEFALQMGAAPRRLANKHIVLLQFSAIDLATGNWWPLPSRLSSKTN